MRIRRNQLLDLLIVSCLLFAAGCTPPAYRAHPDLKTYLQNTKTIGLAPPDIKIYSLTAGGVQELRDDWSDQGKQNVTNAVTDYFKKKNVEIRVVRVGQETEQEMEDLQAVYRAVHESILLHTYDEANIFPEKAKHFGYSIGSIEHLLKPYGANALIIVYAVDEISTGGRKFLKAVTTPLALITGVTPRSGITAMSIALVDQSGEVLWYNIKGNEGGFDLRKPGSASSLMHQILSDFPRLKR